jgi:hypothetical protein
MPDGGGPTSEFRDSIKRHAQTLAAGLVLSERMRGRAEFFRVMHRTNSRNDFDFEARTIDALIALAASNHLGETRKFDPPLGRDRARRAGST